MPQPSRIPEPSQQRVCSVLGKRKTENDKALNFRLFATRFGTSADKQSDVLGREQNSISHHTPPLVVLVRIIASSVDDVLMPHDKDHSRIQLLSHRVEDVGAEVG